MSNLIVITEFIVPVGDILVGRDDVFQTTGKTASFYQTSIGPIYLTEARPVADEELITYTNQGGDDRFRQYAKDPLPPWATFLRLDNVA